MEHHRRHHVAAYLGGSSLPSEQLPYHIEAGVDIDIHVQDEGGHLAQHERDSRARPVRDRLQTAVDEGMEPIPAPAPAPLHTLLTHHVVASAPHPSTIRIAMKGR